MNSPKIDNYVLTINYYLLPITCYLLPVTCYLLPLTYYLLPNTFYLIPITSYLLPNIFFLKNNVIIWITQLIVGAHLNLCQQQVENFLIYKIYRHDDLFHFRCDCRSFGEFLFNR